MNKEDNKILYDYPVSYAFRAYEAELNGEDLPRLTPREPDPPEYPQAQGTIHYHTHITPKTQELEERVKGMEAALAKHISFRGKKDTKYTIN